MSDRFFLDADFQQGQPTQLTGTEANHLGRVMRKQPGDVVELFNGRGAVAAARVTAVSKRSVELDVEHVSTVDSAGNGVWLAVAPPKGERLRWMVEKLTELGVERLIPLQCERAVVNPGETKLEKLRQNVIAACKQCRRNTLMEISEPIKLPDVLQSMSNDRRILLAHPDGESLGGANIAAAGDLVCVGPEGGFSDSEIEFASEHGASLLSLGSNILRIETAAIAIASIAAFKRV